MSLSDYLLGRQTYYGRRRSPSLVDLLAASGSSRPIMGDDGGLGMGPVPQVQSQGEPTGRSLEGLAAPLLRTATSGPRKGQMFQSIDLGGGQTAHVYYDKRGRRQVMVF